MSMSEERAKYLFRLALGIEEEEEDTPVLFEDEIAEALDTAGPGAKIEVYDLFPDATVYYYGGTYDIELVRKIYDALENHCPVTVNGTNIVDI